jgi:hypothetical protein
LVPVLPPDLSATFIIEAILPLAVGFVIGLLIKRILTIGLSVAAIILILIITGFLSPVEVLKPLLGFMKSSSTASDWIKRVAGYLPYASLTFVLGIILGLLRG